MAPVAHKSAQRLLSNKHLSEKSPIFNLDHPQPPNQRYTKTAFDTVFFVARQRNFFPGARVGSWSKKGALYLYRGPRVSAVG